MQKPFKIYGRMVSMCLNKFNYSVVEVLLKAFKSFQKNYFTFFCCVCVKRHMEPDLQLQT